MHQLGGQTGEPVQSSVSRAVLNYEVSPLNVTEIAQRQSKRLSGGISGRPDSEDTNPPHLLGLLRPSGERRDQHAKSKSDREPDPQHEHLGGRWLAGSLADECCPEELA